MSFYDILISEQRRTWLYKNNRREHKLMTPCPEDRRHHSHAHERTVTRLLDEQFYITGKHEFETVAS